MKFFADKIDKIRNHPTIIFVVCDVFLIFFSVLAAFLLRFDGKIPAEKLNNLWAFTVLAVFLTIPIFLFRDTYKTSWLYVSLTDLPNIIGGVIISSFALGTALFIFRGNPFFVGFPRSIIFIYTILLFLFVGGLRFSKRIYWQLIRSKISGGQEEIISSTEIKPPEKPRLRTILVTGGAGYVGSVLCRQLLNAGYKVKVIDKLLFGNRSINELKINPNFQLIQEDILNTNEIEKNLFDVEAVIHLAAIVGEAACASDKELAIQTNYSGTVYLARLCKAYGIKRFIFASTCSTYGKTEEEIVEEESHSRPVDFYGETKIYAERELVKLMDKNFSPTILRFSTVYGLSPRMRFDLIVNTLTKKALKEGKIVIFGGEQWRPLIHVADVSRAISLCLEVPISETGNQIINVGDNKECYLISELGELVRECIPGTKIEKINNLIDQRSYRVGFSKIEKILNFRAKKTVKDGIIEVSKAIKEGRFGDVEDKKYYNHLI